jgi:hypothetical protein
MDLGLLLQLLFGMGVEVLVAMRQGRLAMIGMDVGVEGQPAWSSMPHGHGMWMGDPASASASVPTTILESEESKPKQA